MPKHFSTTLGTRTPIRKLDTSPEFEPEPFLEPKPALFQPCFSTDGGHEEMLRARESNLQCMGRGEGTIKPQVSFSSPPATPTPHPPSPTHRRAMHRS